MLDEARGALITAEKRQFNLIKRVDAVAVGDDEGAMMLVAQQ